MMLFYRCLNGGTCIDGVDNFTCSCPPDLTGIFCECLILDDNDTDCSYIRSTSLTVPTSVFNKTISTSSTTRTTQFYITTESLSTLSSSERTYESSSPEISTEIPESTSPFTESSSVPTVTETYVPNITSVTLEYNITSSRFFSTDMLSSTPYGTYTSIYYGSETPFTDVTTQILESTSTLFGSTETEEITSSTTIAETSFSDITKVATTIPTYSETFTSTSLTSPFIEKTSSEEPSFSTPSSTEMSEFFTGLENVTTSILTSIKDISTVFTKTEYPYTSGATEGPPSKTPKSINWTEPTSIEESSTKIIFTSVPDTSVSYSTLTSSDVIGTTWSEETTTDIEIVTAHPMPDCSLTPCHHGGTCIVTIEGHKVGIILKFPFHAFVFR